MQEIIIKALAKATELKPEKIHLERPEVEEHGDYATNIALQVKGETPKKVRGSQTAKSKRGDKSGLESLPDLSKGKSSREFAQEIFEKLSKDNKLKIIVSKIEMAGPGFINFWLSDKALSEVLAQILRQKEKFGASDVGKGEKVVLDYSAPNIAKRFSVGHLRSTIIGQAIRNLHDFLGYTTVGDNHLGDWGTQFGMIIAQVVRKNLEEKKLMIEDYQRLYVEYNREVEADPKLKKEGSLWFKKLEGGDPRARKIWQQAVETSLKEFDRIYDLLGVKIENAYGESHYESLMPKVIDEVKKKGLVKESKGAQIIELEGLTPAILVKSDGGTTYFTRDLVTLKFRQDKWAPALIIYEVGQEQTLHFRQVFATVRKLGWLKETELVHVGHGLFRFKGKKMATRLGTDISLEEVLLEAVKKAKEIVETTKTAKNLSSKEKNDIAEAVGIGSIKYYDLMHHPTSNIDFDWEKVFLMEGNSGPYLQYTFARAQSVLRKDQNLKNKYQSHLKYFVGSVGEIRNLDLNREELALLRTFPHFQGVCMNAAKTYSPNLLCNYLFDLAQKFNTFYARHRIVTSDKLQVTSDKLQVTSDKLQVTSDKLQVTSDKLQVTRPATNHLPPTGPEALMGQRPATSEFRLALTAATGQILKNGLDLLGIRSPEKM